MFVPLTDPLPEPPPSRHLLTPAQAAAHLGVPVRLLERWRRTGQGPAYVRLSGKCIRYAQDDLDAHVWVSRRYRTVQG